MKITIVTGAFLPLPPAACGAVELLWRDLGEEFARRGHEVTFLCRAWPGQNPDETVNGVRYVRRGGFARTNRLKYDLVKDLLYSVRMFFAVPAGDVCVTNVFWLPVLLSVLRPGAGRVVVNVARAPKGQMGLYKRVARLACTSSAVVRQVVDQTPAVAGIAKVLPNPIDTAALVPPAAPRAWDGGARYLVYTGRVHPEKGVHVLVDAFARLPGRPADLVLRIVGPTEVARGGGGPDYVAALGRKAAGLPVEFLPAIADRRALAAVLQGAHYYCYPSLAEQGESFGVAPLEAMATGLAPVVSDLACFRDFVEDGVNGTVFDHRTDPVGNLAAALARAVADTPRTVAMGEAAARTARRFGNAAVAELFLADFDLLVAGRGRDEGGGGRPAAPPAAVAERGA